MYSYRSLLMLLLVFVPLTAYGADVTNLKSRQEGHLEIVEYDLMGELGESEAEVTVILETGGRQYKAERLALAGDFGKKVKIGRGKRFVWNIAADFPAGFEGDLVWDVTARSLPSAGVPESQQSGAPASAKASSAVRITSHSNTIDFMIDDLISLLPQDMAAMLKPRKEQILREALEVNRGQAWTKSVIKPAPFTAELTAPLPLSDHHLWAGRFGGSLRHAMNIVFSNPKDPLNEQLAGNIRAFVEQVPARHHQVSYAGYAGRQTGEAVRELYSLRGRNRETVYPALLCALADIWASVWKAQGGASPFAPAVSFVRKPMNLGFREGISTMDPRENPCERLKPGTVMYRECMASYYERMRQDGRQKRTEQFINSQEQKQRYPARKP